MASSFLKESFKNAYTTPPMYQPKLRVAVHGNSLPTTNSAPQVDVFLDARNKKTWPILTQLNTDLRQLPIVYELRVGYDWFVAPYPLPKSRVRKTFT